MEFNLALGLVVADKSDKSQSIDLFVVSERQRQNVVLLVVVMLLAARV